MVDRAATSQPGRQDLPTRAGSGDVSPTWPTADVRACLPADDGRGDTLPIARAGDRRPSPLTNPPAAQRGHGQGGPTP